MGLITRILRIGADRDLKRYQKIVARINEMEPTYVAMTDGELKSQTQRFRERHAAGESLDQMLPEAFACVREASRRTLGLRHFDVQLIGGMALHEGRVAEMRTGEGKTLVSTLAGYLNAIPGEGVHIVTVNDYLAGRDREQMGRIYRFLDMDAGLLVAGADADAKRAAYAADVTYGTNSEFGFDYLRDNMATSARRRVQRGHAYAIVDEADSILIDEARTPLIISGKGSRSASTYRDFARAVRGLERGEEVIYDALLRDEAPEPDGDFVMDEARRTIAVTERGLEKVEGRLNLDIYADLTGELVNHLNQAMRAEYLFHRDKQYVVRDGEVKIVDEFTGRIMEGRRYSEGLHQAIEAKEGVPVREENQTLATITLQNYFRLYDKLAGMTGTALSEDEEFRGTYHMPVQPIPTNRPVQRQDHEDLIFRTARAKYAAVADEVAERHETGQPVLVGTASIENSERLSRMLSRRGVKHEVLNAKNPEREAQIIAQAGRLGAVTIATNMAGRGTDILLGGDWRGLPLARGFEGENEEVRGSAEALARLICSKERERVRAAGGLCVIGTERHESRRIDDQLRGRAGRQGDPGETQFYLSLEDDLMRMFGDGRMERVDRLMQDSGADEGAPLRSRSCSRAIEAAQRKVEDINAGRRKQVLEYDDIMDRQRRTIYAERDRVLGREDMAGLADAAIRDVVGCNLDQIIRPGTLIDEAAIMAAKVWLSELDGRPDAAVVWDGDAREVREQVVGYLRGRLQEKAERFGGGVMDALASQVMLRAIDTRWPAYLTEMDYLKAGIGLRGFAQKDPVTEYKMEAHHAFGQLVHVLYRDFLCCMLRVEPTPAPEREEPKRRTEGASECANGAHFAAPPKSPGAHPRRTGTRRAVRLTDPCPCGSGLPFAACHGAGIKDKTKRKPRDGES